MPPIKTANHAAGGRSPTSPARAAQPKTAAADAPPKTRYRPRGSRSLSAIKAHAATPTPAAITTRCMTSTARLTAGVYAAWLVWLLARDCNGGPHPNALRCGLILYRGRILKAKISSPRSRKMERPDFNHTVNSVQMTTRRPRGPVDNLCTPLLSSVIHDKPVERIQEISEADGFREVR
jgi:hypothetical protein